ncbi:MAG: hypothetical protein IT371_15360 [Deltaproteobacteria bacterium]|nr:hypothetical protein [Deltaproteobacteria bacterium]
MTEGPLEVPGPAAAPIAPAATPPSSDAETTLSPWLHRGLLALWVLVLLLPATRILRDLPIYGDDHSSHRTAVHTLVALLRSGSFDLYCPTFNLGFPMYLYYQPLPHFAAAGLHLVSFGLLGEQLAFNLSVVLLWCAFPVATYLGARRLGLGATAALFSGLAAPLVSSTFGFGFTLTSVMGHGLYTQTYAMVLFPLALGAGYRAVQPEAGRRELLLGAALLLATALCHAFYAVALATALGVVVLCRPRQLTAGLWRALSLGGLVVVSLLFWIAPLLETRDVAGGWPWGDQDRIHGYGALKVLRALATGKLLDDGQLPVLTGSLLVGTGVALARLRSAPPLRALLACFALFLFFLMGRRTFGHLVDLQPANLGLELFRYAGPVHGCAVLLAGVGLAQLVRWGRRAIPEAAALLGAVALLAVPAVMLLQRSATHFHTIRSYELDERDLTAAGRAVDDAVREGTPPGRVYAHTKTGHGTHLVAGLLGSFTSQPLGQSYGVGMHDSLGFYHLEYLDPLRPSRLALYNFRFALARPDTAFARAQHEANNPPLLARKSLSLYRLPGDHGYLDVVSPVGRIVGPPRAVRPALDRWVDSALPEAGEVFEVTPTREAGLPLEPGQPELVVRSKLVEERTPDGRLVPLTRPLLPRSHGRPGRVLASASAPTRHAGTVHLDRAGLVALKVAYHPWWRAEVDRRPARALHVSPAFPAVRVPRGLHEVAFAFRPPRYPRWLLGGTLLLWALLLVAPFRRARGRRLGT